MPSLSVPRVLVVDDEVSICRVAEKILRREGFEVRTQLSPRQAVVDIDSEAFDIVVTDLRMSEMGGLELLDTIRTRHPDIVTIVITGYASVASVVETMKLGAFDYLPKPFTSEELAAVARKAWEKRRTWLSNEERERGAPIEGFAGLVGRTEAMQEVYAQIRKVAPTSATVLVMGEVGTGKETVARAIHATSPRSAGRFIAVDCGGPGSSTLEATLFGHAANAIPGLPVARRGLLEEAHEGTVFLDEICSVSLDLQGRLLRFIQDRQVLPIGETVPRPVDVRLVIATARDLERTVQEGAFREDLFYRLHVFPIRLPPLRDRRDDIPLLAFRLLRDVCARIGKSVSGFSDDALKILASHDWPGNVRQLEGVIEWAVISCSDDRIDASHLPRAISRRGLAEDVAVPVSNRELVAVKKRLREQAIVEIEREFVLHALSRSEWNVTRASVEVGMLRPNFQAMMRKHGIRSGQDEG